MESGLLKRHLVVVIEIVDADDFITAVQQGMGQGGTNETGGTGNEYFHDGRPEWAIGEKESLSL